jgi:FdrA protein
LQDTDFTSRPNAGFSSLEEALQSRPDARLVVLSVPGEHAAALARQTLEHGQHVFCFSHHISIEDEVALKQVAMAQGLLMMGPDCGTARIDGIGLGFANQVPSGTIGIVSASGSGLQEVMSLIGRLGGGVSQAVGVGGRDMSAEVGGVMAEQAVHFLAEGGMTQVLVVLAKSAAPDAVRRVLKAADEAGLPVVADFMRTAAQPQMPGSSAILMDTFEQCACRALELGGYRKCRHVGARSKDSRWKEMLGSLKPSRRFLHGLFGGGSLCAEARLLLEQRGLKIRTNLDAPLPAYAPGHILLDFGSEEFTQGSPHPFIDPRQRSVKLRESWSNPEVAILLLDIVLGWGCHPDPAGELSALIESMRNDTTDRPLVIASVCGTDEDPQCYSHQRKLLEEAGVLVLDSNAQAATLAAEALLSLEEQNA